jgi:hypothetical protein
MSSFIRTLQYKTSWYTTFFKSCSTEMHMSLYERHLDKVTLRSAQMHAVNWRLQRYSRKLVATGAGWTLHYFIYKERESGGGGILNFSYAWHEADSSYSVLLFSKIWYRIFIWDKNAGSLSRRSYDAAIDKARQQNRWIRSTTVFEIHG